MEWGKMNITNLAEKIVKGKRLKRNDDLSFFKDAPLKDLCKGANYIRRELCGDKVDLCSIINGRSGGCSENCKFCAQSSHHNTHINQYSFLDKETIIKDCELHCKNNVHRYSIVTAGRTIEGEDLEKACEVYKELNKRFDIKLCASHGIIPFETFVRLKECGVQMYHENIETSRRNFPNICTTHTFDDKIEGIINAHRAGLSVCSGGIIGMGETFEDRIDMAVTLSELDVESIPINSLIPIEGTEFSNLPAITEEEILRTIAMFRYINPTAYIRLAAGRSLMENSGARAFLSGANSTITGNMLTTSGNNISQDKEMLIDMGFKI